MIHYIKRLDKLYARLCVCIVMNNVLQLLPELYNIACSRNIKYEIKLQAHTLSKREQLNSLPYTVLVPGYCGIEATALETSSECIELSVTLDSLANRTSEICKNHYWVLPYRSINTKRTGYLDALYAPSPESAITSTPVSSLNLRSWALPLSLHVISEFGKRSIGMVVSIQS